ncbi:MAG TPA: VWA domain-containing protein [Vicinamibacterales bacterium]
MSTFTRIVLAGLVSAVAALIVLAAPAQEPSFRATSSELVVLPVIVTDHRGVFVPDVARERFSVFDNGRPVPIEIFTNQDSPATVGLVIDASSSMRNKMGEVQAAALAFARSSNPEDELFALRFNDDVDDAVPGRKFLLAEDAEAIAAAIGTLKPDGQTALYDALLEALERLGSATRARKALVVISDGGDNASQAKLADVLARARRSNAAIYTVGVFDRDDDDRNPGVLKSLAEATGALRFLPQSPGELLRACVQIAHEIRSGYTIGYVPPDKDGAFHRVRVAIQPDSRPLTLRTRPGYFAAKAPVQP